MAELKHPHIVTYHDSYYLQEGEFSYICIVQVSSPHLPSSCRPTTHSVLRHHVIFLTVAVVATLPHAIALWFRMDLLSYYLFNGAGFDVAMYTVKMFYMSMDRKVETLIAQLFVCDRITVTAVRWMTGSRTL